MAYFSSDVQYGQMTVLRDETYLGAYMNNLDTPVQNGSLMTLDIDKTNEYGPIVLGGAKPSDAAKYKFVCIKTDAIEGSLEDAPVVTGVNVDLIANHIYVKQLGTEPLYFVESLQDYNDSMSYDTKTYGTEKNHRLRAHKLQTGEVFVLYKQVAMTVGSELTLDDLPFKGKE